MSRRSCTLLGVRPAHHHVMEEHMYRVIAALFLLLASVASSSAQDLSPSVWQGQRGSLLKVLGADAASGNFTGVFIGGPCPGVPYQLAGQIRGPRVVFQTSRSYIARSDCPVTTVGLGRFVSPTTVATRWIATYAGPNGRPVRVRGEEIFQRI